MMFKIKDFNFTFNPKTIYRVFLDNGFSSSNFYDRSEAEYFGRKLVEFEPKYQIEFSGVQVVSADDGKIKAYQIRRPGNIREYEIKADFLLLDDDRLYLKNCDDSEIFQLIRLFTKDNLHVYITPISSNKEEIMIEVDGL